MNYFAARPLITMLVLSLAANTAARADGFGINATRLIYPQGEPSISVTLRNTQVDKPWLVRALVSLAQDTPVKAPFMVTPPLFRLEAQSTNQVRIAFLNQPLPTDRESVFYFYTTAIPASEKPGELVAASGIKGMVQFGVGNIIKLFYRPTGLTGSSTEAQKNLHFERREHGLEISNPSAYFVSLNNVTVNGESLPLSSPEQRMLAPYSSHVWAVQKPYGEVLWTTINDYGGFDAHRAELH